jgi:glycosyltransferase involved in cell wall biosynthesis
LIVPAYQEAERLPATLQHAAEALPRLASASEIIVVDDGSDDATAAVAERFASPVPLRVIRLPANRGKGAAVAAGIAAARHPYVAFTDADCPYDLERLRPMLAALATASPTSRSAPASSPSRRSTAGTARSGCSPGGRSRC